MTDPRASDEDLTAKARIRNAALDLYAERGEDRVSLRAVAAAAGVAVGLVQHHFKTKDGLRVAVEQLVVDYYALAIASVPDEGAPAQVAAARDEAVRHMLATHPTVVNYIRRAVLDPQGKSELLERLTDLQRGQPDTLQSDLYADVLDRFTAHNVQPGDFLATVGPIHALDGWPQEPSAMQTQGALCRVEFRAERGGERLYVYFDFMTMHVIGFEYQRPEKTAAPAQPQ